MSVLDQRNHWDSIDPRLMRELLTSFPAQFKTASEMAKRITLSVPARPRNVVVSGMGGSAMCGDVVRSAVGKSMKIPMVVNRDYSLPGFVDSSSLVIACSYSGNTEETLCAYQQARAAKASVVSIASGGKLAELAAADGIPFLRISEGLPPRAALGYASAALLGCLQALDLVPHVDEALNETFRLLTGLSLRYRPETPESQNEAKTIARLLYRKVVAVYGSSEILDAAAVRWRSQIEENAKNLAFHHLIPEMNHNELVGWANPAPVIAQIGVVLLRDREEHSQVRRRFEMTRDLISTKAGIVREAWTEGESLLARIFSIIYLGDFVSLYLAYLNSVDPTPVIVIDTLKRELSR